MKKNVVLNVLIILLSTYLCFACTAPNPNYKECNESERGCPSTEICNAEDDDQDGMIDEDLDAMCLVLLDDILQGESKKSYFAHQVVSVNDQNGDGMNDLLVSTGRPQDEIADSSEAGSLYLIDGVTQEVLWTSQAQGDFAHQVVVGDYNRDQVLEVAVAIPNQKNEIGKGAIKILDLNGEVIAEYISDDDSGLGLYMSTMSLGEGQGDALVLSEPYKTIVDSEDSILENAGKIFALQLDDLNQPQVLWEQFGDKSQQQFGMRLFSIFDINTNQNAGFITSLYRTKDGKQIQQLKWIDTSGERVISPFSVPENTLDSLGNAIAWGMLQDGKPSFAFSVPSIEVGEDTKGRVYIITPSETGDTKDQEVYISEGENSYGQALITIPSDPSRDQVGDYLLIASADKLYVMNPEQQIEQSIDLPHRGQNVFLTRNLYRDKQGCYHLWLAFAEEQRIYHMSVR